MQKSYHKINTKHVEAVWLCANQWESKLCLTVSSCLDEPCPSWEEGDDWIHVKMEPRILLNILNDAGITLRIRKARKYWHVVWNEKDTKQKTAKKRRVRRAKRVG